MNMDGLYALERRMWENYKGMRLVKILDPLQVDDGVAVLRFSGPAQSAGRIYALVPALAGSLEEDSWHRYVDLEDVAKEMEYMVSKAKF